MAKKKRRTKRRNRSLSSGGVKRRTKRRGLSSGGGGSVSTKLTTGFKRTLGAMAGGGAGVVLNKLIPASVGKLGRIGIAFAVGIGAAFVNAPIMGAGLVGAMTAQAFPNGFLNDDDDTTFADDDVLSDRPLFLDEDDNAMVLEESPSGAYYRYLNDDELALMERAGAFDDYTEVG